MRFISYSSNNDTRWGAVVEAEDGQLKVVDLRDHAYSLKSAIEQDLLGSIEVDAASATVALDDVRLLPPILAPEKIMCIGVNYANRNAEYKDNSAEPSFPSVFIRTPDSLTGHGSPLIRPPESPQLDYEGEIVVIIGKGGRRIARENAYEHIAGLTIMNEGTIRDWVRHAKFNVTQGKNFVQSGSVGPWMVTADQFSANDYQNMRVTTHVNGEERQNDTTANMMFPIDYIISYLSTFTNLKPGDVIATGTPNGAGARFDPPRFLAPGDVVEVTVEGVGKISNGIEDEIL